MRCSLRYLLLLSSLLLFNACKSQAQRERLRSRELKLEQFITSASAFDKAQVGFVLADATTGRQIYQHQGGSYLNPASNLKLYTYAVARQFLPANVPALQYSITNDTLYFTGTGNPLFLHPDFADSAALHFLKNSNFPLVYVPRPHKLGRMGPGWSWDDYDGYYATERSNFPMYGNNATFYLTDTARYTRVVPDYFYRDIQPWADLPEQRRTRSRATRDEYRNSFAYYLHLPALDDEEKFARIDTLRVPFLTSDALTVQLLADTLKRDVRLLPLAPLPLDHTVYSLQTDTLYKFMLEESDNLLAEQLLAMASLNFSDTLDQERIIDYAQDSLLTYLPDEFEWADGSGMSRYSLTTARNTVAVLLELYKTVPFSTLQHHLAVGGESGTVERYYEGPDGIPYVWGKTGTLSNNHNFSGYLVTRTGRAMAFSLMVNHYITSTWRVKRAMEQLLKQVYYGY